MKVKELIALLQQHDPEADVWVPMNDGEGWLDDATPNVRTVAMVNPDNDPDTEPAIRAVFGFETGDSDEEAGVGPVTNAVVLGSIDF